MPDDRPDEIKELLEERRDSGEDEPVDSFHIRVGQVQWNEDPERAEGGYWLASFGPFDHELDGLTRDQRELAREQAKDYVAEMILGKTPDWFFRSDVPKG